MKDRSTKTLKIDTHLHKELKLRSIHLDLPIIVLAERFLEEGISKAKDHPGYYRAIKVLPRSGPSEVHNT